MNDMVSPATGLRKGRVSYSIEAEDLLLANAWQKLIGKALVKGGSYLDLGAAHPVDHSNTFYFYEHGWRGICVEANPEMCALYKQYRPQDRVFNIGIAPVSGTLTYHRFDQYLNNGFLPDKIVGEHIGRGETYLGSVDIKCVAVADFLRNEVRESADILNIDIETMEPRVLGAWDWAVCRPKLICVEIHSRDLFAMLEADVTIILKRNGYAPISRGIMSAMFIDAKFLP
jgi:FkbM family methyltransferase